MSLMLSHLKVFPDFFKYLQAFGQKSYARDEGFSGYNMEVRRDTAGVIEGIGIT